MPELRPDAESAYCTGVIDYTRWFLNTKFLRGPDTWCALQDWHESKRMRNDVAKAWRRGYVVERASHVGDVAPEMLTVLRSASERQGRSVNTNVIRPAMPEQSPSFLLDTRGWPVRDYRCYTCPNHYCALWTVRDAEKTLCAFMDVSVCGDIAVCCAGMAHADHRINGVMNMLFHALMSDLQAAGVTHLFYGNKKALDESTMGLWLRGAGFVNSEKLEVRDAA